MIHYLLEYKTIYKPVGYLYEKLRYLLPFFRKKYEFMVLSGEQCLRTRIIMTGKEGLALAAVLSGNGRILSKCMLFIQPHSISVSEVETAKDCRRCGYASKMLRLIISEFQGSGKKLRLHVSKDNIPAMHLYSSLGFEICECLQYYF